jgi:tetratricopeptide (TPR) repeat protein
MDTARSFLEGSIAIARESGDEVRLASALNNLGHVETDAGNVDRAAQLLQESLALHQKRGDLFGVANTRQALAIASLRAGRAREAREMLSRTFDYVAGSGDAMFLANTLEVSACIVAELGDGLPAARLAAAAEAVRQLAGIPLPEPDAVFIERYLAPARATIARDVWDAELAAGRALTQRQAAALLLASSPAHGIPT